MTPAQFLAALEALVADAQKLTTDTNFLAEATAILTAAKALIPTNTLEGIATGVKSDWTKVQALFKKI